MNEEGTDLKQFVAQAQQHLQRELSYGKLTAVEKSSIVMSRIAIILVLGVFGAFAFHYITSTLVLVIGELTGKTWLGYLIMAVVTLLVMVVVFAMRKQWIIDPITRFVTRLFLNPNDND